MKHFLDTTETIGPGHGFPHFGKQHFGWLAAFVAVTVFFFAGDIKRSMSVGESGGADGRRRCF